jgi:hypothetical protein
MITLKNATKLNELLNDESFLDDATIAMLVKMGVEFPNPETFDDMGNEDVCYYTDHKTTDFSFGAIESIAIRGTTSVSADGVENWTDTHIEQHAENLRFFLVELDLRDSE